MSADSYAGRAAACLILMLLRRADFAHGIFQITLHYCFYLVSRSAFSW